MRDAINIFLLGLRVADIEDWIPYGGNEELCVNMKVMLTDYDFKGNFSLILWLHFISINQTSFESRLIKAQHVRRIYVRSKLYSNNDRNSQRKRGREITTFVPNFLCKRLRFRSIEFVWNFRWWAKIEYRNFINSSFIIRFQVYMRE